ncbi:hypothetical protein [Massilia sp. GCM10023247]|uniref:hypothetical protein n=1 Tax=Massilia sp. GCM10023247 TaxID=3252643 RepID=UPI00360D42B8
MHRKKKLVFSQTFLGCVFENTNQGVQAPDMHLFQGAAGVLQGDFHGLAAACSHLIRTKPGQTLADAHERDHLKQRWKDVGWTASPSTRSVDIGSANLPNNIATTSELADGCPTRTTALLPCHYKVRHKPAKPARVKPSERLFTAG